MTIRNIFIDFGGVIVRTEDKEPRQRAAEMLGLSTRQLEAIIFESVSSLKASVGEITEEQHWQAVALSLQVSRQKADEIVTQFFAGDRADQNLLTLLRSQRPERKVGLISNAWSGLRAYITKHGFVDVFDHMTISAEVGVTKPDGRIYQLALEALQARADESVFIDDVAANVEAARLAGMSAVQFISPAKALEDINKLLLDHR